MSSKTRKKDHFVVACLFCLSNGINIYITYFYFCHFVLAAEAIPNVFISNTFIFHHFFGEGELPACCRSLKCLLRLLGPPRAPPPLRSGVAAHRHPHQGMPAGAVLRGRLVPVAARAVPPGLTCLPDRLWRGCATQQRDPSKTRMTPMFKVLVCCSSPSE